MNRYTAGVVATIAAVVLAAPAGAQKTSEANTMLAAAQQKETLEGDPSAAIKQYSVIVAKYSKTDRAVTAMALVHMAECYQKLGDAQARSIYELSLAKIRSGPKSEGFGTTSIEVSHARCRAAGRGWVSHGGYQSATRHLSGASEHTAAIAFHLALVRVKRVYAARS